MISFLKEYNDRNITKVAKNGIKHDARISITTTEKQNISLSNSSLYAFNAAHPKIFIFFISYIPSYFLVISTYYQMDLDKNYNRH
ncbi:MAG: ABC transporter ATPase component [Caudoviricetes sp.]|nr:MAG: ABC transporter ATPase component [Caudoviricetes sp.]